MTSEVRRPTSDALAGDARGIRFRAVLPALATLLLAGCGDPNRQSANESRGLVPRRADAAFAEGPPRPDDATLARSRRIDAIERLIEEDRFDEARRELDALFAAGEDHPRARLLMGRLHAGEGRHEEAIPWFDRAIALSPRWPEPRLGLAQSYLALQRLASAESVYQDFDRLAPEAPWGPWGMGAIAWQRGDGERGKALLDEALRRDPAHVPSLRTRAAIAAVNNDAVLERDLLERLIAAEPQDAAAHERLGRLLASAGLTAAARHRFRDAWDLAGSRQAARGLAELAEREGDEAEARRWRARIGEAARPADAAPAK